MKYIIKKSFAFIATSLLLLQINFSITYASKNEPIPYEPTHPKIKTLTPELPGPDRQPVATVYLSEALLKDANKFIRKYRELTGKPEIELLDKPVNISVCFCYPFSEEYVDRNISVKPVNMDAITTVGQWLKELDTHFWIKDTIDAVSLFQCVNLQYLFYVFQKIHSNDEIVELLGVTAEDLHNSYCVRSRVDCTISSKTTTLSETLFLKIHNLTLCRYNPATSQWFKTDKIIDLIFNA